MDELETPYSRSRQRRLRRGQFSLRTLMGLVSGASIVISAFTFPGVGGVLIALFACTLPALIIIATLVGLQLPLMLVAARWSQANRQRLREERRALSVLKPRSSG
jgi:hypothetical protein